VNSGTFIEAGQYGTNGVSSLGVVTVEIVLDAASRVKPLI
jgi:hypothetical protein